MKKKVDISKEKTNSEEITAEALCPSCGKGVITHKCELCGATKNISPISGNVVWMRNGRIVEAFINTKESYVIIAKRFGIPENEWYEKYK